MRSGDETGLTFEILLGQSLLRSARLLLLVNSMMAAPREAT